MSAATATLISEIYKRPILWDPRNKNYHSRGNVDREWNSVCEVMNITKEAAKAKWKSLRDNYRKELSKSKEDATSERRWVYFKTLHFLEDVMETKKPMTDVGVKEESEVFLQRRDSQEQETFSDNTASEITEPSAPPQRFKKRKRGSLKFNSHQDALHPERTDQGDEDDTDDDLLFFKSLLPYMKMLPPIKRLCFRSEIQIMLANEISALETGSASPSVSS
ncbi:transcription factor Adf-1-like [Periplaneta americana]|uniref:transcription factor Adf-1-like n=1 Tax=Periplaneta americana TaxID=6978 RepID=UPI0037E81904